MDNASPVATAELIVRNSRKQGTRRALRRPVTIIGSTQGCDVRLEVDNVRPLHCLIALGSDGPFVRSWAPDTFVNDEAVSTRRLQDGDLLRVGPFEFEIRWTPPVAEEVVLEPADPPLATPVEPFAAIHADELLRQVREARATLRRERGDLEGQIVRQLEELAETRDELTRERKGAVEQRNRLDRLRAKFLARWKRHWATRRLQLDAEARQLAAGWEKLGSEQAEFEAEQERRRLKAEVETRRIEHGWQQLRAAERAFKAEREHHHEDLRRQHQSIADERSRQKAEALKLRAERMQTEHRAADLRIEADGIESRVVNLRAVLLQLEAARAHAEQRQTEAFEQAQVVAPSEAAAAQEAVLVRLAEDLQDQRALLAEQVARLAQAREMWRAEQSGLLVELDQLAEEVRRREEHVADSEKAIGFEREQIDRDTVRLEELKERLLVRQTRLEAVEAGWRSELGRRELDLQARDRELTRREAGIKELCRRWGEHRRAEILPLRESRRRSERLAMAWLERTAQVDDRERRLERREQDTVARALAVEKARQRLLDSMENPELAAKKLDRLERQLTRRLSRSRMRDATAHSVLTEERLALVDLYRRSEEMAEHLAAREREVNIQRLYSDRQDLEAKQEEARVREAFEQWRVEREMYERERRDLHDEVERLASVLLQNDERPAPAFTARAA